MNVTADKEEKICVRGNRMLNVFVDQHSTPDDRPTIFFVHGSMANYRQFDHLIESLRKDHNIVAWDAYGCGKSEKPRGWGEYSADAHLEDVLALVKKYKTTTNHLICHR
jgi:pimeloyl-ACP methyl ester carboxylesterase